MIGHWYYDLLQRVMNAGAVELNHRTGAHIRALANQVVELDCSVMLPTIGLRRTFPHVAAAELAWTLSGTKSVEWLLNYTKMWENFQEEDGTVEAAYGYRWRNHFGRDQFLEAIDALAKDPSNRQVVVLAWDPGSDGLMAPKKKNVPCPLGFSLSIIGGKLNMAVYVRSSDVVVGLPYDVMHYALLLDVIYEELFWRMPLGTNLTRGSLLMTLAHAHVYDVQWDLAWKMLANEPEIAPIGFPSWNFEELVKEGGDKYVDTVKLLAKPFLHQFHEKAEAVL